METPVIVALIAAIVTLFGIVANHRLLLHREKTNSFRTASEKLREAFSPSLARLKIAKDDDIRELRIYFKSEMLLHLAAIEDFKPFARDSVSYQKACVKYKDDMNSFVSQGIYSNGTEYIERGWIVGIIVNYRSISNLYEVLIKRIDDILIAAT